MFNNIYKKKKVIVTGHTGFKGSWLVLWLQRLGAEVCGYSLEPNNYPNHFDLLKLDIKSIIGDILDRDKFKKIISDFKPEIVFHLAAQPLVRKSYNEPVDTFMTNVIGTVNVLDACRNTRSVLGVVNVTSDKCYENIESDYAYKEDDKLGGHDPYSASKGCSELVTSSYRNSYGNKEKLFASARAGNVVGGGDWAEDRLIPDIMRATANGESVSIRNPMATRPWQHVLEPLSGYLQVGQKLLEGKKDFAQAWNFGPYDNGNLCVKEVVDEIQKHWDIKVKFPEMQNQPHEAMMLKLNCSKALERMYWSPVWGYEQTMKMTAIWYKEFYQNGFVITKSQLDEYINCAKQKNIKWALE